VVKLICYPENAFLPPGLQNGNPLELKKHVEELGQANNTAQNMCINKRTSCPFLFFLPQDSDSPFYCRIGTKLAQVEIERQ